MGHEGRVRLHGRRLRADGRYGRPRFWCVPTTGSPHTFSLPKLAPTHAHADRGMCLECERASGRSDGSSVVPASMFALINAARLLVEIGGGSSLRKASRRVRIDTDRRNARNAFSKECALAADYLDGYGPLVVARVRPAAWPRILVLDSVPLEMRVRDADAKRLNLSETHGGAVLVAVGKHRPDEASVAWEARFSGGETGNDWWEFLHTLPLDPAPEWVVADGAKAIRAAVLDTWPGTTFFPCLYHLRERLKLAAGALVYQDPALAPAIEVALSAPHHWDRLVALAKPLGDTTLWKWIRDNDELVRSLDGLRRRLPGAPEGNGAAETVGLEIRERIGGRKRNFTNARRLDTVVGLMRADIAGVARAGAYLEILRASREAAHWRLGHGDERFWERAHDPANQASVADAISASRERAKLDFSELLRTSQTKSVMAKVAADNAVRASLGLPPLVATVAPGARVASVKVRGTRLRDYPEVLRDWDPANAVDPRTLLAGSDYEARWKCVACGHEWPAPVSRRTMRRTRCARCHRPWLVLANALATTHPELVEREWVREANLPVLPEVITARRAEPVIWRCADFPGVHPDYPMSPRARVKADLGCPVCRQIRSADRRRKPRPDDPRLPAPVAGYGRLEDRVARVVGLD